MTHKLIQSGQLRAYADTIRAYEITADPSATDEQVWAYAQTFHAVNNRNPREAWGFPFGLEHYGTLTKKGDTTWRYAVTEPYTD